MQKPDALKIAEPVVKNVVNCIAAKKYEDITKYAEFNENDSAELLGKFTEETLSLNELPYIDEYGVPCSFHPKWETADRKYEQLEVYIFDDGTGFSVNYDLTTDGDLNDLTLQMEFTETENGSFRAVVTDIHIL